MTVDPLAHTDSGGRETMVSLPPTAKPVALPRLRSDGARPARAWMLVAALLAGVATSVGVAYAMHAL